MHTISDRKLLMLKPSQIRILNHGIRKNIDLEKLEELSHNIALNGIINPIAIRKNKDGFYELISGERRLRAAAIAGLRRVPCVLHNADAITAIIYSLTENIQRNPIHFFDEAVAIYKLIYTHKLTFSEVSLRLGISVAILHDKLSLLELDNDLRDRIVNKKLSIEYAKILLLLPEYQRFEVLSEIINNSLSIVEAKNLVERKLNPTAPKEVVTEPIPEKKEKQIKKYAIGDIRFFGNSLQKLITTLKSSGMDVGVRKTENNKYIEYKVRIKKEITETGDFKQLKIC